MDERKTPIYVKALIIICVLPALLLPFTPAGSDVDGTIRLLRWGFPVFVALAAVCAWKAYAERPELSWLLILIMVASEAGMFYLNQTA